MNGELPKGMTIPSPPVISQPKIATLASTNYLASIYCALAQIPEEILIDRCEVVEQNGQAPEVRLYLRILVREEGPDEVSN